jgi:hypothetical protein
MICKICDRDVSDKFYRHLNSSHKMKKGDYLKMFPDQQEEYDDQVPENWNKGLTKGDHPSIAKCADSIREYSRRPEVRKKRSKQLKARYLKGDILDSETRARVVKAGSDGWVKRIKNADDEERKLLLENFTKAGNDVQNEKRHLLTPEDYNRLYPFAKGVARYHGCEYCGKQMIAWFGGKPRPKKRFCNQLCCHEFIKENPFYVYSHNVKRFYSSKMRTEFCLRSKLELWVAELFEKDDRINSWCTPPFHISYEWEGKSRRYYPDFFTNEKFVIEVKSDYIRRMQGEDRTTEKLRTAEEFCLQNGYKFLYWQFDKSNLTEIDVCKDKRIIEFMEKFDV